MQGTMLFATVVLPSLAPFMIAVSTLSSLGVAQRVARFLEPACAFIFHLPGESAFALICALLCGNPVSAQVVGTLYADGALNQQQAQRTAALCSFVSPAFLFGTLSAVMLENHTYALPLAIGHYGGALLCGIFMSLPARKVPIVSSRTQSQSTEQSGLSAFTSAVRNTALALPQICIFLAFFSVVPSASERFGATDLLIQAAQAMKANPAVYTALSTGFWEMTAGCAALCKTSLSAPILLGLSCATISFGGLCILCQNSTFLTNRDLAMGPFLLARCIHAILAFLLTYGTCLALGIH